MTADGHDALRAEFEPLLRAELAALAAGNATRDAERAPVELDQQSVGRLARMDAMQRQAMAQATERRRQVRRRRVEAALKRIEDDEFGWCGRCGEAIGLGRLRVDPTTALCLDCAGAG